MSNALSIPVDILIQPSKTVNKLQALTRDITSIYSFVVGTLNTLFRYCQANILKATNALQIQSY